MGLPTRAKRDEIAPARPGAQPERRLLVALLTTAVLDLFSTRPRDHDAAELRAREWIAGAPAPVSFVTVCEFLGLDAGCTRAALLDARHLDSASLRGARIGNPTY